MRRKILGKYSKHLLPVINEHKQLTVTMVTNDDISGMLRCWKCV